MRKKNIIETLLLTDIVYNENVPGTSASVYNDDFDTNMPIRSQKETSNVLIINKEDIYNSILVINIYKY